MPVSADHAAMTIVRIFILCCLVCATPQIYDMMLENSWRDGPIEVSPWLASYATRRYAVAGEQTSSLAAQQAWVALFADVYSDKFAPFHRNQPPSSMISRPPSLVVTADHVNGVRRGLGLGRAWLQVNS